MDNIEKIKDFFNEVAGAWDGSNADSFGAKKIVKQFAGNIEGKKVLDIGCGTGVLYEPILKNKPKSYTGIDVSEEMIKLAKEKYPKANYICEDVIDWKTDEEFDTIIMYNVYPHLMDKQKLVDKVNELINEKGAFIVAHGSSKETVNSHHSSHAMEISRILLKAEDEAEIWRAKFDVNIIRDNELYYFSGTKK